MSLLSFLFLDFSLQFTHLMFIQGCDTTSKIGTKYSALNVALSKSFDGLVSFGQIDIDEETDTLAEKFFVRCICKDENINTFDQPYCIVYYMKSSNIIKYFAPHKTCISEIVCLVMFSVGIKFGN